METLTFDPVRYKQTTLQQWQSAAEAWYRWSPAIHLWLGKATGQMLELAGVSPGQRILDIAAGAGEQSIMTARRIGPAGYVLATDLSPNILEFAKIQAAKENLSTIETRVMDGEDLTLPDASFDVIMSRVGLIYFPDQQRALRETWRVLKPGGRIAAIVYSTADKNEFFSIPISIIRRRAQLPPPLPGQPGPFSLGAPGVIDEAFTKAGFGEIKVIRMDCPVLMTSAAECVRFEKESFGALHQMMSGLPPGEREDVWKEIENGLVQFERNGSFVGPCEMIVAVGRKK